MKERCPYPQPWLEHEDKQPHEKQPSQEVEKARSEIADLEAIIAQDEAKLAKVRAELAALQ